MNDEIITCNITDIEITSNDVLVDTPNLVTFTVSDLLTAEPTSGTMICNTSQTAFYKHNGGSLLPLDGDVIYSETDKLVEQQKQEEKLRNKNPNVNEAWEHYQLMLKMCRDEKIDETNLLDKNQK